MPVKMAMFECINQTIIKLLFTDEEYNSKHIKIWQRDTEVTNMQNFDYIN